MLKRPGTISMLAFVATSFCFAGDTAAKSQDARIQRVEAGLLPPVLFGEEKPWSLTERMKHYKVPGLSIAVFDGGRILWSREYGLADVRTGRPVTPDTLFQAASISKPVTCFGALRLVQEGRLDLDVPVNGFLTSWKLPENDLTRGNPVTLRRIMSHSAGLTVHGFPGYKPGVPLPTIPQILDGQPPANNQPVRVDLAPGTRLRYSSGGTTILELAMADTTAKPFPALMEESVLKPLGMAHSAYAQPLPPEKLAIAAVAYRPDGNPVDGNHHVYPELGAAGLWTTATDLARFAIGVQASLHGRPGALLRQSLAWSMVTRVTDQCGLGFFIDMERPNDTFLHGGGNEGFRCHLVASKAVDHGVAIMTNSDNGNYLGQELIRAVAREYGWADLQSPSFKPLKLGTEALTAFTGRYRFGSDQWAEIRLADGSLRIQFLDQPPMTLVPVGEQEFVARERLARFTFDRERNGTLRTVGPAIQLKRLSAQEKLPSELAFENRLEEAVAAYRRLQAGGDANATEERLNALGYALGQPSPQRAVAILRVNTLLYPGSANAFASLAEVSLQAGNKELALQSYRKVLEVLDRDPKATPLQKVQLRKSAESQIKALTDSK